MVEDSTQDQLEDAGEYAVDINANNGLSWSSFGISHVGGVRKHNEDSMLDKPKRGLWVVADGMGGHEGGDFASQMIVRSLDEIPADIALDECLDEIEDRLLLANERLREKASQAEKKITIGSTVVGLLAHNDLCSFFWAGDSRLYRLRKGALRQLTTDHSRVEFYVAKGSISRRQAAVHPEANIVTRAVGAAKNLYVDFDIQKMQVGDRYMLCSDGLTKHLKDEEFEVMLSEGSVQDACDALTKLTLERGAGDNVTTIVIDIE